MGDYAPMKSSKILPTVFKWNGGGKEVFMSGSFSEWKTIPMVKRYNNSRFTDLFFCCIALLKL